MTRFLSAAESQQVFRAVLDALARPGTVHRLPARGDVPAALLPLLALADLSTPACVLAGPATDSAGSATEGAAGGAGWPGAVRALTSAPVTGLREARLVAGLRPVTGAELSQVRVGTAAAPEDGALVTLAVDSVRPGTAPNAPRHFLSGPGIPGTAELRVAGLPADFTRTRRRLTAAFPAGADFLLVAPDGTLAGLPRTTLVRDGEAAALWATRASKAGWRRSSRPSDSSAASGRSPPGCPRGMSSPGSGWRWTG